MNIKHILGKLAADSQLAEIFSGSAWLMAARVVSTMLGLGTTMLVARVYGAQMLGVLAVLNTFLSLAAIFSLLGVTSAISRLIPEHMVRYSPVSAFAVYRKIVVFGLSTSVVIGALLFFGSGAIARGVFAKADMGHYFALGALFVVFVSLKQVNTQALLGLRRFQAYAFMELLPAISKLLILAMLSLLLFDQDNPFYALLASTTIAALASHWIVRRAFRSAVDGNDSVHPVPLSDTLAMAMPMFTTILLAFIISETGVIALGIFCNEAEVGYYAAATKLAALTSFVIAGITTMTAPRFSELFHSGRMNELFSVGKKASRLIFWTTTPIFLALIIFGKFALWGLFGHEFTAAYRAMILLALGQFVNAVSGSTGAFMNMTGHHKEFRNIMFMTALVNIVLNMALVPGWGVHGAALAGMTSLIFWNALTLWYMRRKYGRTICHIPFVTQG